MSKIDINVKKTLLDYLHVGKSINSVAVSLNLNKSTVYYHYKKVYGKKIKLPSFQVSESEVEGEIAGAFAADGGCCRCKNWDYLVTYYIGGNEVDYVREFALLLASYFNKKPYIHKRRDKNVFIVRYRTKSIYNYMKTYLHWENPKTYSVQLKTTAMKREFLRGFVRGYFDCDGYADKAYRRVQLCGVSGIMISQLHEIIGSFGFTPTYKVNIDKRPNCKALHTITLKNKEAEKFVQFFVPRNPIRIKWWGRQDLNSRS